MFIAALPASWHTPSMKMVISPDPQYRIVLTRQIREAAGLRPGEKLQVSATPGRIVLELPPNESGRVIRKGKLKVWTGKVPPVPLEEAVDKARKYSR